MRRFERWLHSRRAPKYSLLWSVRRRVFEEARLTGMLDHNYHGNARRLVNAVNMVDGISSSSTGSLDDGRAVAVR
jgi:hypothetical protein